jgi:putative flippase GtrA
MYKKVFIIYKRYEEIINYLIVGGLTTFIGLIVYFLCVSTFLNPYNALQLQIANLLSWILAVSFAYFTNRKYVFKSNNHVVLEEVTLFVMSRAATLLVDMGCMFFAVTVYDINDKIAKIFAQIIIIIANYLLSKYFVFHNRYTEKE